MAQSNINNVFRRLLQRPPSRGRPLHSCQNPSWLDRWSLHRAAQSSLQSLQTRFVCVCVRASECEKDEYFFLCLKWDGRLYPTMQLIPEKSVLLTLIKDRQTHKGSRRYQEAENLLDRMCIRGKKKKREKRKRKISRAVNTSWSFSALVFFSRHCYTTVAGWAEAELNTLTAAMQQSATSLVTPVSDKVRVRCFIHSVILFLFQIREL